MAIRQKAMASDGATAALIRGAAVDVPNTPTTSNSPLPAGGRRSEDGGAPSITGEPTSPRPSAANRG